LVWNSPPQRRRLAWAAALSIRMDIFIGLAIYR
jgi:hypothetical protein